MKLIIIGAGNMGSAIGKALLKQESPLFEVIWVKESSLEKCLELEKLGAKILTSLGEIDFDAKTFILLAVKPQDIEVVLADLKNLTLRDAVIVSIAAGVNMTHLQTQTSHPSIVRVMPNTPVMIGQGASGWLAALAVTGEQKKVIQTMLESFGLAIEVENEDQIDVVTALSGSGPAYVFYFLEALIEGAIQLGLSSEKAQKLAIQTIVGGGELAKNQASNLAELQVLRQNVTSKGGTTERALEVFAKRELKNIVAGAMQAAYNRTKEL